MLKLKNLHIYSNRAYLIPAVLTWPDNPLLSIAWAALALSSWVAHTKQGNYWKADWVAMYLVFCSLAFHNNPTLPAWVMGALVMNLIIASVLTIKDFFEGYIPIGIFFTLSAYGYFINSSDTGGGLIGLSLFALGLGVRQFVHTKDDDLSNPHTNLGHSLWHWLTAIGGVFLTL
jgi:hypothetical protein